MPEQGAVGEEKRMVRVVNVGGFRRGAVQFDDCEAAPRHEFVYVRVAQIKSAEIKAVEGASDSVDAIIQGGGQEPASVLEHRSLAVVAGHGQREFLAFIQHPVQNFPVAGQKRFGLHAVSRVGPDELPHGGLPVARQLGESLVGYAEDASPGLVGEAVIKDARLEGAGLERLSKHEAFHFFEITLYGRFVPNHPEARRPLAGVRLQNDGERPAFLLHDLQNLRSPGRRVRLFHKVGGDGHFLRQIGHDFVFGLAHHAALRYAGVGGRADGGAAIFYG